MLIAAVHIELPITLPLAGLLAMALMWYWRRLSRSSIPPSRRRIRRFTTVLMGICLPVFVLGLSVHDPEVNQQGYLLTWTLAIVLVILILLAAAIDMANNLRLHRLYLERDIARSLQRIEEATRAGAGDEAAGDTAS